MKNKVTIILLIFVVFIAGFISGGILFRNRSHGTPITVKAGKNLLKSSEISGLLSSVVLNYIPQIVPKVILETDRTICIEHPFPERNIHYLFFSKKDIKNIGDINEDDYDDIVDIHASIAKVIKMKNIKKYKLMSNGPGRQHIAHIHFHLMAD